MEKDLILHKNCKNYEKCARAPYFGKQFTIFPENDAR